MYLRLFSGQELKKGRDMKTKVIMLSLSAALLAGTAFAQGIENDDMYFNAKDRAKLKAQTTKEEEQAYTASAKKTQKYQDEETLNPTDSYSARNVNPEYAARSNAQTAKADEQDYFISDYKYANATKLNSWNNNFNNAYNNPWYSSTYFGPSIYSWNSPYYGSYYDQWGNPWMNPYYQSGWSSSYSYYMGSNWNYGWGSGFGMSLSYGNPYYGGYGYSPYSSFWGPSYGYGGYYGGYYGYPSNVVIINNGGSTGEGRSVAYGPRATSNSGRVGSMTTVATNGRTRPNYVSPSTSNGGTTNGRVTTQGRIQSQEDYYNRAYRQQQQQQQIQQTYSSPSRSDWGGSSGQSHYNSGGRSDSFGGGSRSSFGGGGGGTAGGGSFHSGGSNGRSRGRD
jgi:hypothetical protein